MRINCKDRTGADVSMTLASTCTLHLEELNTAELALYEYHLAQAARLIGMTFIRVQALRSVSIELECAAPHGEASPPAQGWPGVVEELSRIA